MASVRWTLIDPSPDPKHGSPCGRSSHSLSFVRNSTCLVLHGGERTARTPLDHDQATWAADLVPTAGDKWQWRLIVPGKTPPPRVGHSQAVVGGDAIYVFGGRMGIGMGEKALNDLWVLDCSNEAGAESWALVEPIEGAPPEPRSFHKMVSVGSDLYVFGGCGSSGRLADLHKFDTVSKTWSNMGKSDLLRGRGGANLIHFEGSEVLAIIAGFCGQETNDGHRFILGKGWERSTMDGLGDLRPRSVCISAYIPSNSVALIFGGEVDPSDRGHEGAGGFENDLIILDGETGTVKNQIPSPSSGTKWPEKRGWSDGAVRKSAEGDSTLYIFGGLSGDDTNPRRLADLWRCDMKCDE